MCRSDTSETKTQQKRAFPCATIGTYSLLRFLHALKRQALIFSLPSHPPLSPLLQFVFNFLFISCIEYCFGPFTAAPLICGLAFRYQVSAVSFAWLCGGDLVYCPPYFNQSANVLIALTVSKGISQVNVVYHCGNSDQMALPSVDFLNPLPYAYLC